MVRYLDFDPTPYSEIPAVDARDVTGLIPAAVAEVLERAEGWLGWDGTPVLAGKNVWTPHKALRRVADHLLDHLTEIEARLAGIAPLPDQWHGRKLTLGGDWARFTEADLDEAESRLRRLALCYQARLAGLNGRELDSAAGGSWTIRQVVHHVSHVTAYADLFDPPDPHAKSTARPPA